MNQTFANNSNQHHVLAKKSSTSQQDNSPETLTLRIASSSVSLYANAVSPIQSPNDVDLAYQLDPPSNQPHADFIILLSGKLSDFIYFAGDGADDEKAGWLMDIAHDICDPCFKRGHLWLSGRLAPVSRTDRLVADIYEYRVISPISLTKISVRKNKSQTASVGKPQAMGDHVKERDHRCWISRKVDPLINSHICPKRMEDAQSKRILEVFSGSTVTTEVSVFDPQFGIALIANLDKLFDVYNLGFRATAAVRSSPLYCGCSYASP
jgi:hypothetical protein